MKIGEIDLKTGLYLIAEAGSNHDGSLHRAKQLVKAAADAGANAVKFQLFTLDSLIQPETFEKVLGIPDQSWRKGFRKLEFPLKWYPVLRRLADRSSIDLLCTPFDEKRMAFYLDSGPAAVKIASGDLTCIPLLRMAGKSRLPVILSTGAGLETEVKTALKITGSKRTVVMDCVMSYPARPETYGNTSMDEMKRIYKTTVGLSDHTQSCALAVQAVLNGAAVVERHFTLDNNRKGADHAMSTEPAAFQLLATSLRDAVQMRKKSSRRRPDWKERQYARRGVYAARNITAGEILTGENCIPLRPAAGGIPVAEMENILGHPAGKSYQKGQQIKSVLR